MFSAGALLISDIFISRLMSPGFTPTAWQTLVAVTKVVTVSVSVQVSQHTPTSAASTELLWTGGLPECAVSLFKQHCPGLPLLCVCGSQTWKTRHTRLPGTMD